MFTFLPILAEMIPQGGSFWDAGHAPVGDMLAVLLFLLLLCVGIALDVALVLYFMKRPARPSEWGAALKERALPGLQVFVLLLVLSFFYLVCSLIYGYFFPDAAQLEPHALIFQSLCFHLPALLVLSGVFLHRRRSGCAVPDIPWRRVPALLGLSVLLYLAAFPILWFYSALYQLLLYKIGLNFYLQEVAELFLMPAPALERAAMYFVAIIVAPLFEELLFRGVLLPWMVRRAGYWPGIVAVSLLFAGMHFHLPSFMPLFLLSGMFCIAYSRTRSLLVPFGMHACFNAVTVILLALAG